MLNDSRVVAFVPTRSPEKARSFYENKLRLEFISDDGFALVFRSQGTTIRLVRLQEFEPAKFTVLGWDVPDVRASVRELREGGIEFQRYSGLEQDALGIWTAPGGAMVAWFLDPDGNVLSISQH